MVAAITMFLGDDETTAEDANLLGGELAALGMEGDELFGAPLQTSASIFDAICTTAQADAVGTLQRLMALIQEDEEA